MTPKCWADWQSYFEKKGYRVSAPAWPLHEGSVQELRQESRLSKLGQLRLAEVIDHYREILKTKEPKPILVGHSMGGLIAQILLSEGLGQAAIAIDSAAPNGKIVLQWSFLQSNWPIASPFAKAERPIELDLGSFSYSFVNAEESATQHKIYDEFYVPESRQVGKDSASDVGKIDSSRVRGPLLIVAGNADHIIPAPLNYKNFKIYRDTPSFTEFKVYEGRDHWTIGASGWEQIAADVEQWLNARFAQ